MAPEPDRKSELEEKERVGKIAEEVAGQDDEKVDEDGPEFEQPSCPRCGWHNTRPSHHANLIDNLVRMLGLRAYRCRSCGNRFRALRRIRKD
jgi:hypothetical protein